MESNFRKMIEKISIQNFRCFGNTTIEGFKRINLIGGLNNSGKTALLEAILLNSSLSVQSVVLLNQLRSDALYVKEFPEYTWDNFFLNQNKEKDIMIKIDDSNADNIIATGKYKRDPDLILDHDPKIDINDFDNSVKLSRYGLYLIFRVDEHEFNEINVWATSRGLTYSENIISRKKTINFLASSSRNQPSEIANEYSIAERNETEKPVLEALQIIDKKFEAIRVSVVGGAHIEIKIKGGKFMPSTLFGDAINKILRIVLKIVTNKNSILLIDEIENGMHHSVQKDFWKFLFQLAIDPTFDVQIFSTSHSLEMIQAFTEVAQEFENEGAYFELFFRKRTGEISYNLHDFQTLEYELSHQLALRGE